MSLVLKAWKGVEALATIDGASNVLKEASTALLNYLSKITA
jgi:hypothetical protein